MKSAVVLNVLLSASLVLAGFCLCAVGLCHAICFVQPDYMPILAGCALVATGKYFGSVA